MSPTIGMSPSPRSARITNLSLSTPTGNVFLLCRFQSQCLHRDLMAKPREPAARGSILSVQEHRSRIGVPEPGPLNWA